MVAVIEGFYCIVVVRPRTLKGGQLLNQTISQTTPLNSSLAHSLLNLDILTEWLIWNGVWNWNVEWNWNMEWMREIITRFIGTCSSYTQKHPAWIVTIQLWKFNQSCYAKTLHIRTINLYHYTTNSPYVASCSQRLLLSRLTLCHAQEHQKIWASWSHIANTITVATGNSQIFI